MAVWTHRNRFKNISHDQFITLTEQFHKAIAQYNETNKTTFYIRSKPFEFERLEHAHIGDHLRALNWVGLTELHIEFYETSMGMTDEGFIGSVHIDRHRTPKSAEFHLKEKVFTGSSADIMPETTLASPFIRSPLSFIGSQVKPMFEPK